MTAFGEMGVLPELTKAVDEMNWMLPTDVQAEAIPAILGGGDVLMAAETGSGKTGAFCLPIIQIVWETLKDNESKKQPTNRFQTAVESTSKMQLSFFDRDADLAVSPDGLACQSRDFKAWNGVRSTIGVGSGGKYYYEGVISDEGLCRIGWSTLEAKLELGVDNQGFGFGGTGKKSFQRQFDDYGEAFGKNDIIGCLLDVDNKEIRYSKNGVDLGSAFVIPPSLHRSKFFAAVVLKNAEIKLNFGDQPFKYLPGVGFIGLSKVPEKWRFVNQKATAGGKSSHVAKRNSTQAIIIEPSRELAEQTYNQIKLFKKHLKDPQVRDLLVLGGSPLNDQISAINSGVDIIVATPGRLNELISNNYLSLSGVRFFVLDEADGLLSQGHSRFITDIHKSIPLQTDDGKRLQMVVCSATLHSFEVKKLAQNIMHFPTWIDLKGQDSVPETVHHVVCMVNPNRDTAWTQLRQHVATDGVHYEDHVGPGSNSKETLSEAVKMLKGEYVVRAIQEHNMDQALIFCRTKLDCDNLENYLNNRSKGVKSHNAFSCVCLHSDRPPAERNANLTKFKQGYAKFLICTDVAARGIDVKGVPYVINVTLPDDKANYIHRIGRVGRAERMGLAISLVSEVPEKVWYHSNCKNRGKNCYNTKLTDFGGCCIWYKEPQYLADIEDHLGVTIQQVDLDLKIASNEFDGKVVYGQKKVETGSGYKNHVNELAFAVNQLSNLETEAQSLFLLQNILKDKSWMTP